MRLVFRLYECSREWTPRAFIFAVLNARDSYAPGPAIAINCASSRGSLLPAVRGLGRNGGEKNWKSRRATRADADSTRRPAVCEKLVCAMSRGLSFLRAVLAPTERMKKLEAMKKIRRTWIDFRRGSKMLRKFIKIFLKASLPELVRLFDLKKIYFQRPHEFLCEAFRSAKISRDAKISEVHEKRRIFKYLDGICKRKNT